MIFSASGEGDEAGVSTGWTLRLSDQWDSVKSVSSVAPVMRHGASRVLVREELETVYCDMFHLCAVAVRGHPSSVGCGMSHAGLTC
jgi:hypothetical protein